jgi:DNA polymerase-3 subunit gamma/tau
MVGTRGVGKTSIARIFAKAIRCEKLTADGNACNECAACQDFDIETSMNVIEIDGASNNSVDNIRDLVSNVHYLPTTGKYKVYIIDEVHMLSTQAFNALLKTLEEPPAHVIFIFATTEGQKLLGTVLSRCQRFDFRNVMVPDLVAHVKEIARVEGISFEREDLIKQLAVLGNGSVRDTLSLLDQVLTFSENNFVKEETFTQSLGVAGISTLEKMVRGVFAGDINAVTKIYHQLLFENISLKNICSGLMSQLFLELTEKKHLGEAELIWIYESFAREMTWVLEGLVPEKSVEVLLYKITLRRSFFNGAKIEMKSHEIVLEKKTEVTKEEILETVNIESEATKVEKDRSWDGFLAFLGSKSPASASNLEQGNLTSPLRITNDELFIELGFGFSSLVFLDYLRDVEVFQKLIQNLCEYFEMEKEKIYLELKEVAPTEDFISRAEIKEKTAELDQQDLIETIKNNPMLREAEKIFNAKVDKVIIETKK